MNQKINLLLSKIKLLENSNKEELENLSNYGTLLNFISGEQIIDRNSENKDVFFVISGSVRVVNYSSSGREIAFAKFSASHRIFIILQGLRVREVNHLFLKLLLAPKYC